MTETFNVGPVYKVAAFIPISSGLVEEIERMRSPWKFPDARVLPKFDLFPRWTAAVAVSREVRRRWRNVLAAARGAEQPCHDYDDY